MNRELNQASFGPNAESYAASEVHAKGASLERMRVLVKPAQDWSVLDIATGAGHTALTFAPLVRSVLATDITREMLEVTKREAAARGFENVDVEYADAERLPFPASSFDLVTCRIAPHHFPDPAAFVREAARVLRPGGTFALVDNIVPPGPPGAYVNAFEKLRDPSHARCLTREEWLALFAEAGLALQSEEQLRKAIRFSFWAKRHTAEMQAYLLAMLTAAGGEAGHFLAPVFEETDTIFHLLEGLFVLRKDGGR